MNGILLVAFIAIVVLALIAAWLKNSKALQDDFPYTKSAALFSPAERSFLGVLQQAVGGDYAVFGKVRVADVVSVRSMSNRGAWQRAFNRISAKHFDYVLCAKGDLSVICAIELDDQSHQQQKRQQRDAFLVGVCRSISLPLIQVPAQRAYSVSDLQAKVFSALRQPGPSVLGQVVKPAVQINQSEARPQPTSAPPIAEGSPLQAAQTVLQSESHPCPKCSAPMVPREVSLRW